MKSNLQGKKKDLFFMYPRFLQMILNEKYPQHERSSDTLDIKALGPNTFGLMKQSRKTTKVSYQGLKELVKFGKFAKVKNTPASSSINVEVVKEHMAPISNFKFALEEIEVSDDDEEEDQEKDFTENEFDDFLQSISILDEDVRMCESSKELIAALIAELQRTMRKPPQAVPVTTEPPSESDQEDSTHRSPMAQNMESTFTEPRAQASGSSFVAPELDISKGKSKLPESEFVDDSLLQNRVFDLEQTSTKKDLIIGKQDIRISDLEKENSIKDEKISELQANLGCLSGLFFDLKQCLHQNFGDDFQPLSVEGEKIYASSSGPANPISQSASELIVRPAPDANLDAFFVFGSYFYSRKKTEASHD
uniref:Uncharacterized protein n=1 Tax=Lactuca sativa TaxID=4236 RepID=A0A9R1XFB0_LACSA|nr:hypothetical protein LSAT_V11C400178280 [Lactuca sativa]